MIRTYTEMAIGYVAICLAVVALALAFTGSL